MGLVAPVGVNQTLLLLTNEAEEEGTNESQGLRFSFLIQTNPARRHLRRCSMIELSVKTSISFLGGLLFHK